MLSWWIIFGLLFEKRLTPTWFEHATFWSGVRRATVAPRSPSCIVSSRIAHTVNSTICCGALHQKMVQIYTQALHEQESRVAQWKRAGPITQRSVDRNYALLKHFYVSDIEKEDFSSLVTSEVPFCLWSWFYKEIIHMHRPVSRFLNIEELIKHWYGYDFSGYNWCFHWILSTFTLYMAD